MRFTIEQHFSAGLEAVESAFVDPAFLDGLSDLANLGRPTLVNRVEEGHLLHLEVNYSFTGELNATVRRVVDPARLTWVEVSTLDRRTHITTWRIVPDHYRNLLRGSGTFRLYPVDPTTTGRTTEADINVSLPLVGSKVEKAIVAGLREHAALEEDALDRWLSEPPSRAGVATGSRPKSALDDDTDRRDNGYMTLWPAEDGWPYPDSLGDFVDVAGEVDDDLVSMRADTHLFDSLDSLEREVIAARFGLRGHEMRTAAQLHFDLGLPGADIEVAFGSGLAKLRTHLTT